MRVFDIYIIKFDQLIKIITWLICGSVSNLMLLTFIYFTKLHLNQEAFRSYFNQ